MATKEAEEQKGLELAYHLTQDASHLGGMRFCIRMEHPDVRMTEDRYYRLRPLHTGEKVMKLRPSQLAKNAEYIQNCFAGLTSSDLSELREVASGHIGRILTSEAQDEITKTIHYETFGKVMAQTPFGPITYEDYQELLKQVGLVNQTLTTPIPQIMRKDRKQAELERREAMRTLTFPEDSSFSGPVSLERAQRWLVAYGSSGSLVAGKVGEICETRRVGPLVMEKYGEMIRRAVLVYPGLPRHSDPLDNWAVMDGRAIGAMAIIQYTAPYC